MKYVMNADGSISVGPKGHPMIDPEIEGKAPYEVDAMGAQDRITTLNTESAGHRKKAAEYKIIADSFEGIDPAIAREAIVTVGTLGENHKVDMDKMKTEISKSFQTAIDERDGTITTLNGSLFEERVMNKFATSEFVKKTTILPPAIAAATFKHHFDVNGQAKDAAGNVIFSKENPGVPAKFDEAFQVIFDQYPLKNEIARGTNHGGGGGHNTNDGDQNTNPQSTARDSISAGLKERGI